MQRVPRGLRTEIREAVRQAYFVAEDPALSKRVRYDAGRRLDTLWNRVTGLEPGQQVWPRAGWLGCIRQPRNPIVIDAVAPRRLVERSESLLSWGTARVEALERAFHEAEARSSPGGRVDREVGPATYDPTDVPSYEYVREEF